jgi:hypothetical protein
MRHPYQATVTLTSDDIARVRVFSEERHKENREHHRRHIQGFKPKGKQAIHHRLMGYLGEYAFARWLGVPWRADGQDHWREQPDVAGFDVKATDEPQHRLIITPHDSVERRYVLVIDQRPTFYICGWYKGADARRSEWWERHREGGGAWYVPRGMLRIIDPGMITTARADYGAVHGSTE